jgi:uncharacterized protein (TIGR02268 family)
LLLVLPAVALAQPGDLAPEPVARQLALGQTPRPEVWVAPAQATELVLDAKLDTEAMRRLGPVKGLRRVEVTGDTVVLVPASGLQEGETLEFPLWFAEGPPAQLVLRVDSARAEPRVEVYREHIPPEALQRQVAALNARLEALRAQEASLTSLMEAGLLNSTRVSSSKMTRVEARIQGLTASMGWLLVANGRMGLELNLSLAQEAAPWAPATVRLEPVDRPEPLPLRSLKFLGGAALQPGNTTRLLLEWERPLETKDTAYWLQVTERHGGRSLLMQVNVPAPHATVAPAKETPP